ncbi:MAG: 16S rRNA (cytosine(1402)-N(4))-methyltransferase RsmH [Bacilli bacterium]|nr:16S rRNA (cytosine(1402)-N(4))-methyltransferase RsmH [Bacilli bacterium]
MHKSVLLDECIENLNLKEDSVIVDATLGYAGHSSEILKRIKNGRLISFDQDDEAIKSSRERLNSIGSNFTIVRSNFKNMKSELSKLGIEKVDGILFDLGVSSPQLDEDYRGFSFHKDAKLDMRMDQTQSLSAYNVVNEYSKEDLIRIFREFGEEKYSSKIADKIVEYRKNKNIETTLELVDVVKSAVPEKYKREKHPARKVFQAIRIEVNKELDVLKIALSDALTLLNKNGRICVITFHSLEDKIVKNMFNEVSKIDDAFKNLPFIPEEYQKEFKALNVIKPSREELEDNPRARSSKLRVIEKIK